MYADTDIQVLLHKCIDRTDWLISGGEVFLAYRRYCHPFFGLCHLA